MMVVTHAKYHLSISRKHMKVCINLEHNLCYMIYKMELYCKKSL